MKLLKGLLGIIFVSIISMYGVISADNCFDTIIDDDGTIFYIDPYDKYSVVDDKDILISTYGDKIKCNGNKKTYTNDEYLNKIYRDIYKAKNETSSTEARIKLIMLILGCIASRKIFVKAGKPGINSIIPIYNFYELSDIAGLQGMFSKAIIFLIAGILLYFFAPLLGLFLIAIFGIYGVVVNFYVARNFGWSTFASILYVIFNPVAMLILAFGNDKYYLAEQKDKIKEITMKAQINEIINDASTSKNNYTHTTAGINNEKVFNKGGESNSQNKDPIKYIDPNTI